MIGRISIIFATLLFYIVSSQETGATVEGGASASVNGTAPACNKICLNECTVSGTDITQCGTKCHCEVEAAELITDLQKGSRCYGVCRQNCVFTLFEEHTDKNWVPGDCFADCTCICNKECTESCITAKGTNYACLKSCGCPEEKNKTDILLDKQEKYFDMPLDPRSDGEIGEELQGKLSDVVNKKYKNEAAKKKKVLDSKLKKIEKKWNKYADDARKLGINTTVFCDETCSHECFLQADQATYDVLTKCLIGKCQCFKPKLPNVDKKISFEALITLKKIITEEEEDSLKVVDTYGKIADKYEAEVESLKNTANSIDEVIEETLKTVNAKKQHQEAQIVDTKNSIKNPESITSALPANPSTLDKAISSTAKALKKELETASVTLETPPATADPAKSDSEILDPASTEKPSCNLTCFNECLNLKKYIPFPVIQQCIDLRCHCSLKGLTDNAESFIALTSNEVIVKKMEESMQEHSSVLKVFLVFIIVSLITLAAAYLVFKYTEERGKRRAYNSYGVNNDQAYEKLA